ncbi:MAG: hypothetical protein M1830_004434 [Pleopsidium flavum]|nr:MAG: hypothetical protein M1830_003214 [Pleopsidium flavum]KAI9877253.1 MAG: hypothetical protein M1830_004434 [Pleopsidium flavum]
MSTSKADYVIIGAGVFGASTAYHLSQQEPSASIVLIDRTPFPCPIGASHDINKIVRADYSDKFYCGLAIKAQQSWRNDPIYKPYYHQTGMVILDDTGLGRRIIENFKQLGEHHEAEIFDPEELKRRFGGIYQDTDLRAVEEVYWNPLSGWAEATSALKRLIEVAVESGVKYVAALVTRLMFDESRVCVGVRTADGTEIHASKVILCTGAGTAKLIADSAPRQPDLWVKDRIIAAGVCTAAIKLAKEQIRKFKDVPVLVHQVGNVLGETMPPTPDGELKFCRDVSFTNSVKHPASGQTISVPPITSGKTQWTAPENISSELREELYTVMGGIYGKGAEGMNLDTFRLCWDGFTPDQNWLITPHPHCRNLHIATGGSFHGWKFLPILGKYVVQMLKGQLDDEMARRWAWDREYDGAAHGNVRPERELRDIGMGAGGVEGCLKAKI